MLSVACLQASAFSTAQLCTSYFWGVMTDKIGRKPVVLIAVSSFTWLLLGAALHYNSVSGLLTCYMY